MKLSWPATAKEMARSSEDWIDFEVAVNDGLYFFAGSASITLFGFSSRS